MSSLIIEVCKIEEIIPIPNKDRIEQVKIKGWYCIVGKGAYSVGDKAVFIPPDSVLPPHLIEKYNLEYLKNGGKVGTIKFAGTISQGLVLGLDCLEGHVKFGGWQEGDDVAQILKITKWQPPENPNIKTGMQVTKKKLNPLFDKYTDIENIKNYNNVFIEGEYVIITEKIHGSNFRAGNLPIHINDEQPLLMRLKLMFKKHFLKHTHEFVYGSHNVQLHSGNKNSNYYGDDAWGKICAKYDLKNKIPEDYILYGEIYGSKIQDLTYGKDEVDLVIFDIKHNGKYLPWIDVKEMCQKLGLQTVPELYTGKFDSSLIQKYTDGKSMICPSQIREGCVIKDLFENNHPRVGRKILKSVSVDYLNRKGDKTEYH